MIGLFEYSGSGGGGSQNLQQVTDIGNTTTHDLIVQNGQRKAVIHADTNVSSVTVFGTVRNLLRMVANDPTGTSNFQYLQNSHSKQITFNGFSNILTNSIYNFRDITGSFDIAFTNDQASGTKTIAGFTGTNIIITHGLNGIPKYANIVAANGITAGTMLGGYFMTSAASTITAQLVIPVASPTTITVYWEATLF